jgi:uncharacterized protein
MSDQISVRLRQLPGLYTIAQLPPTAPIPDWADGQGFVSITRCADELSVICRRDRAPAGVKTGGDWVCWQFVGPFPFEASGIAVAVLRPIAECGVGVLISSTFDTDYLLAPRARADETIAALRGAGHSVEED